MSDRLAVLSDDRVMGELVRDRGGRLHFSYVESWQSFDDAYPLSLSMPLLAREHPQRVVEPFLWNLLPDNDAVLAGWARMFHVSARNPFALLTHVGEDCPGAVRLVRPERVEALLVNRHSDVQREPRPWS